MRMRYLFRQLAMGLCLVVPLTAPAAQLTPFAALSTADLYLVAPPSPAGGGNVTVGVVMQFREKLSPTYSTFISYEVDCRRQWIRMLRSRNYGGPMASGPLIGELTADMFGPDAMRLQPTTQPELVKLMGLACGRPSVR